ncbi:stabilizer of axonemal microtubules 2 [Latimeria chalumnae]|uniref:Stabilizer of axonemal microtubules 2 n=1 Tax=Latimeria chalumnae TaxID=7897 RepID=H3BAF1_LATCH|nr:PREDICTED: stabilizer of axonemal microtubules 2 [Latimeria chalumnae]XP_014340297.1 PREDICTED: stabilizer of axonemal microtubules 2 [Latimeria chalumnae]|eukprot:XP_005989704.2 PREDICTED: stabilizer of axonemal microtubules 2 [Latimeria chalumnae]
MTEYAEKYLQYGGVRPPNSCKPKAEYQPNGGKIEGTTTFKADFIPYDVVRRPGRVQEEYRPKSGQIDHGTTYKTDYNPHMVYPVKLVRPVEKKQVSGGKLNTLPTYKDDYRLWEIAKRGPIKREDTYHPPSVKFGNSTTFQDDFVPKGVVPRESFKPPNLPKLSDVPFNSLTSHRISYIPHQLEKRYVRPKEEYKPNSQPFQDLTVHRCDFMGIPGEFTKSCKPEHHNVSTGARFEGNSEFRDQFQPWAVSLPHVRKSIEYVPPTDRMDFNTTNHIDYTVHELQRIAPIRPVSHGRKSNVPFQGNSTTKEDFKAWEVHRQEAVKQHDEIAKPSGKFDEVTTFRAHYVPHEISLTQSCKPQNKVLQSLVPFDDGTMYRIDYTPKKTEVCPASYPSPPGYIFEDTNSQGHNIFRKLSTHDANSLQLPNGLHAPKEIAVLS